jgi:hypothetical protein
VPLLAFIGPQGSGNRQAVALRCATLTAAALKGREGDGYSQ